MNQKTDIIHKQGIIFSHGQYRASLFPLISSVEGDLAYRIFDFDIEKNAEDAYAFGRKGGFYDNLKARLRSLLIPYRFDIYYIINEKEAEKFLISLGLGVVRARFNEDGIKLEAGPGELALAHAWQRLRSNARLGTMV